MIRTLLHFIVLGGICFALAQWRESTRAPEPPWAGESAARTIRISAARIDALRDEWIAEYGSDPSGSELRTSLEAAIDEEILFREGLRMGLLRTDPVVRQRLVQNMRFLGISSRDEAAAFRQALKLGMARSDLVVRRRLIQRMRGLLEATSSPLDEAEVREHVRRHPEAFRASPKFRLSYIYLERWADAETWRTELVSGARTRETTPEWAESGLLSEKGMVRTFGTDLARRLMALDLRRWSGPFAAGEGYFLARLDERVPGTRPAFELIEARARRELEQERRQRALTQALLRLRTGYAVEVADRPIRTARAGPAPGSFAKGVAR